MKLNKLSNINNFRVIENGLFLNALCYLIIATIFFIPIPLFGPLLALVVIEKVWYNSRLYDLFINLDRITPKFILFILSSFVPCISIVIIIKNL